MKTKQIVINPKILAKLCGDDFDKAKEAIYALMKEGHQPREIVNLIGYNKATILLAFVTLINEGKLKEEEVFK